jgi:hypothetical protein
MEGEHIVDLSEYAQHLRLVHFTKLLTGFGFCIAVAVNVPGDAERAFEQSQQIARVAPLINSQWLNRFSRDALTAENLTPVPGGQILSGVIEIWNGSLDGYTDSIPIYLQLPKQLWLVGAYTPPNESNGQEDNLDNAGGNVLVPVDRPGLQSMTAVPPENLHEFATFWNNLIGRIRIHAVIEIPLTAELTFTTPHSDGTVQRTSALTWSKATESTILLQFEPSTSGANAPLELHGSGQVNVGARMVDVSAILRPRIATVDASAQTSLGKLGEYNWAPGTFDFSFRDLSTITQTYRKLKHSRHS